jgi:hypothetical protein
VAGYVIGDAINTDPEIDSDTGWTLTNVTWDTDHLVFAPAGINRATWPGYGNVTTGQTYYWEAEISNYSAGSLVVVIGDEESIAVPMEANGVFSGYLTALFDGDLGSCKIYDISEEADYHVERLVIAEAIWVADPVAHVRQQIRDQAVTELSAIATFSQVKSTRVYQWRKTNLPACNVFTEEEESEPLHMSSKGQRKVQRDLILMVEIYATADAATVDDTLDDLITEVELILGNSTLNGLAYDVSLRKTETDYDGEGDVPVGVASLTWLARYFTLEGDPETAL